MFKKLEAQRIETLRPDRSDMRGFTILEVMIALAIFGFLMLYVSQFMNLEIRLFDKAARQDELEQKARFAMMHIVDQIRTTPSPTFYLGPEPELFDTGIYAGSYTPGNCKININPNPDPTIWATTLTAFPNGTIYYDPIDIPDPTHPNLKKLKIKQSTGNYLISDHIRWIKFEQVVTSPHLLKISILAKNYDLNESDDPNDPTFSTKNAFQLITWVRF